MQQQDGSGSKNINWNHFNDVTTKLNEKLEQLLTKTRLKSIKLVVTQPLHNLGSFNVDEVIQRALGVKVLSHTLASFNQRQKFKDKKLLKLNI